ncbi:MAG: HAD-IB family phosphatase [Candidatus Eremiobacteraeota bacterium]|nr:HAD-IB family phosphatase [Candidatus Eremiobacteraeota bacterium]
MPPATHGAGVPALEALRVNVILGRARLHLSQQQLARRARTSRPTISKIERAVGDVGIELVQRIADALGVTVADLFVSVSEARVDDDELIARAVTPRHEFIGARTLLNAVNEAAEVPIQRYSRAGRPRTGRSGAQCNDDEPSLEAKPTLKTELEIPVEIFVDYDATITDRDTFDVLVQHAANAAKWQEFEAHLHDRAMTLREVLAGQCALIGGTLEEADAFLAKETRFDPAFKTFAAAAQKQGIPLTVLSSGVEPLIERAMQRNGITGVPVRANDVEVRADGWIMHFRDGSDNGHDKAAEVRAARARGAQTVFIGDGFSDFDAAEAADIRFAKTGRALVNHLRERGLRFTEFASFTQVQAALFP